MQMFTTRAQFDFVVSDATKITSNNAWDLAVAF